MNRIHGVILVILTFSLAACSAQAQATQPVATTTNPPVEATLTPAPPQATLTQSPPTATPTTALTPTTAASPTVAPTATPAEMPPCSAIGQTWLSPVDGMTMLCVPAGEFWMGLDPLTVKNPQESAQPQHRVYLDAFWVDETEVTNGMYALCVQAGVCQEPKFNEAFADPQGADLPVTGVTREWAIAYCQWAERDLPSEAQWEKAARGTDGRLYPWGDDALDCTRANARRGSIGPSCGNDVLQPVGSYPAGASPYGALDMIGNASEMVLDTFSPVYYQRSPYRNPLNTEPSAAGVPEYAMRGGSWYSMPYTLIAAGRDITRGAVASTDGFRCAFPDPHAAVVPVPTPLALSRDLYLTSPVMSGEDVFALQVRLSDLGYGVGVVDGNFGAKTDSAVRNFQEINGLVVDGWVGPKTWAALFSPEARAFAYPELPYTVSRTFEVAAPGYLEIASGRIWVFAYDGLTVIDIADGRSRTLSMPVVMPMFKAGSKVWIPSLNEEGFGVLIGCSVDGSSCSTPIDFSKKPGFDLGDAVFHGVDAGDYVWLDISGQVYAMPYDLSQVLNQHQGLGIFNALGYDGTRLWLAGTDRLRAINEGSGELMHELELSGVTAFTYDGSTMWALQSTTRKVIAIEPLSGTVLGTLQTCAAPQGIAFAQDLLWISCYQDNQVRGLQVDLQP